jgi:2-phosphosulfolactate phosphatase
MRIERATNETCGTATDAVVVIDVLRAFTTAAFALAAGAREIVLASGVDEALALRERFPGALVMGELDGVPVEDFDLTNSPGDFRGHDMAGRRLIQRTSAGTQGVVRSLRADVLLAASFAVAGATARYLQRLAPDCVTFVITGIYHAGDGDEDAACADYIAALLRGENPDPAPYLRRVRDSSTGRSFADPNRPALPAEDLEACASVDRFDFAMPVERRDGLLVMRASNVSWYTGGGFPP